MNELFTVEEVNLMCIFDTSSRGSLISELTAAIGEFDSGDPQSDAEIREIAENALAKLNAMSDAECLNSALNTAITNTTNRRTKRLWLPSCNFIRPSRTGRSAS